MKIITSPNRMQRTSQALKRNGKVIGFVPTMGYLHQGHLSLVKEAKRRSDMVVASIFVNPIQFEPSEDFQRYPRDLNRDKNQLQEAKCDILFFPSQKEIYPEGFLTYANVEEITRSLEGASRPGHFKGVVTVVAKLFNLVLPDLAFFGQKDAQQVVTIKKMAADLNFPIEIVTCPTVRDQNGLALSSRNTYLNTDEYRQALSLSEALQKAKDLIRLGEKDPRIVTNSMREVIQKNPSAQIEYLALTDPKELKPVDKIQKDVLISMAVRIGTTRLIDNICLKVNEKVREIRC
ncbi:MAG: pantoate--beta-alanine ligase [candidate division Zixibacteria bacterium RBG_16_50_21]|nr:MAG: pantoate--beta-alanine ligase [candidate division Zixibacteria bacterium RBG_16_50_21]